MLAVGIYIASTDHSLCMLSCCHALCSQLELKAQSLVESVHLYKAVN